MSGVQNNWGPKQITNLNTQEASSKHNVQEAASETPIEPNDKIGKKIFDAVHEKFDMISSHSLEEVYALDPSDLDFVSSVLNSNLDDMGTMFEEMAEDKFDNHKNDKTVVVDVTNNDLMEMLSHVDKLSINNFLSEKINQDEVSIIKLEDIIEKKQLKVLLPMGNGKSYEETTLKKIALLPELIQKTALFITLVNDEIKINNSQYEILQKNDGLHDGKIHIIDSKGAIKSVSLSRMSSEEEIEFQKLLTVKDKYIRIVQIQFRLTQIQRKLNDQSPDEFTQHISRIVHNLRYVSAPSSVHKKIRHCIDEIIKKIHQNNHFIKEKHRLEELMEKKKIEAHQREQTYVKTEQEKEVKYQERTESEISQQAIAEGIANDDLKKTQDRKIIKPNPANPLQNPEVTTIPGHTPKKSSSIVV